MLVAFVLPRELLFNEQCPLRPVKPLSIHINILISFALYLCTHSLFLSCYSKNAGEKLIYHKGKIDKSNTNVLFHTCLTKSDITNNPPASNKNLGLVAALSDQNSKLWQNLLKNSPIFTMSKSTICLVKEQPEVKKIKFLQVQVVLKNVRTFVLQFFNKNRRKRCNSFRLSWILRGPCFIKLFHPSQFERDTVIPPIFC